MPNPSRTIRYAAHNANNAQATVTVGGNPGETVGVLKIIAGYDRFPIGPHDRLLWIHVHRHGVMYPLTIPMEQTGVVLIDFAEGELQADEGRKITVSLTASGETGNWSRVNTIYSV